MPAPAFVQFWLVLSQVGSPLSMTALVIFVCVLLASQRHSRAAIACLLIASTGGLLNSVLKALVQRPRPPGAERYLDGFSWSFPSGHAMGSLIVCGVVCFGALPYWPVAMTVRRAIVALAATTTVLVGVSRIALGVHYPGDVAGGWTIGAAWLALGLRVWRRLDPTAPGGSATPPERAPAP